MGKARTNPSRLCTIENCNHIHRARGYCGLHWQRWKKGLELESPLYPNRCNKKGWISSGYKWVSTSDRGEIQEHRYLMEQSLGRRLTPIEVVHHKNGDKLDNRLSNLELTNFSSHTSHHRSHRMNCLICNKDDIKGRHGLCGMHAARSQQFMKRHNISLSTHKWVKSFMYMAIQLAAESLDVGERLESLKLKEDNK